MFATYLDELDAFEADCDRLRKARRESFPVKALGLAPLATLPLLGSLGWGRRLVAMLGIFTGAIGVVLEMDRQREVYGGNLAIDLNPNSDFDNLAGAFATRSPRWQALAMLYSQLDPVTLRDRLGALPDDEAKKILDRMINRVRRGLNELQDIPSHVPGYIDVVQEITREWREDTGKMLDRALFKAGVIDAEDLDDQDGEFEAGDRSEPLQNQVQSQNQNTLTLFDWGELNRFPNHFPHLLLLGKTGAGKTTLAERLLNLLPGDRLLITPHHKPSDFPGIKCIGRGRDYAAILIGLQGLEKEMQERYERYAEGDEGYGWLNVVVDEYPAIAANCGKDASEIMMVLAREARKVKIRLLILSQGAEVKALGIEGNGSVRECFTFLRLRGFCEDHVRRLKDGAIANFIAQQAYPCMVEDTPADTSTLAPLNPPQQGSESSEPMGAWVVDGSVVDEPEDEEEESWRPFVPPANRLLGGWMPSGRASRLWAWMQRKYESTGQQSFTLNDLATGRPLGKKASHSADILQPLIAELLQGGVVIADGDRTLILATDG